MHIAGLPLAIGAWLHGCSTLGCHRSSAAPLMLAASKKPSAAGGFGAAKAPPPTLASVLKAMPKRLPKEFSESCICGSGDAYCDCCRPYHKFELEPESAERCLRTRYSAYAYRLPEFVIKSTDRTSKDYKKDAIKWAKSLNTPTKMFDGYDFTHFEVGASEPGEPLSDGAATRLLGSKEQPNVFTVELKNSQLPAITSRGCAKFVERKGTWRFADGESFADGQTDRGLQV